MEHKRRGLKAWIDADTTGFREVGMAVAVWAVLAGVVIALT